MHIFYLAIFQNQIKIWLKIVESHMQQPQQHKNASETNIRSYIKIISNQKSKDALNRMKIKEQRRAKINECGQESHSVVGYSIYYNIYINIMHSVSLVIECCYSSYNKTLPGYFFYFIYFVISLNQHQQFYNTTYNDNKN